MHMHIHVLMSCFNMQASMHCSVHTVQAQVSLCNQSAWNCKVSAWLVHAQPADFVRGFFWCPISCFAARMATLDEPQLDRNPLKPGYVMLDGAESADSAPLVELWLGFGMDSRLLYCLKPIHHL